MSTPEDRPPPPPFGAATTAAPDAAIVHEYEVRDDAATLAEEGVKDVEIVTQDKAADRERYIPVSRFDILDRMTRTELWPAGKSGEAKRFFRYLASWRRIVYNERLDILEEAYAPFNPERDVVDDLVRASPQQRQVYQSLLVENVGRLLKQANYIEVPQQRLSELVTRESVYNLDLTVDLDEFEECHVFWRGKAIMTREKRSLKKAYLGNESFQFPIYQRLCVLLKLKSEDARIRELMAAKKVDAAKARRLVRKARRIMPPNFTSDCIYLKLFKDIPRTDLEMMFPNTRVKFRMMDKVWLGIWGSGGLGAGIFGVVTKILVATTNPIGFAIAAAGFLGAAGRQIQSVMNQRRQYMMVLAQNLYFHSLADNRGVITLLANRAEEEDLKEEMLLYTMLSKEAVHKSELGAAKAAIEQFLKEEFGTRVDYDLDDALGRLKADGIVIEGADNKLKALSPAEGILQLDSLWDSYLEPKGLDRMLVDRGIKSVKPSAAPGR